LSVPVIVTLVAFVAETVSVDELPALIEVGLATRVAVAAGGGGGVAAATVTIAVAVALPPVPDAVAVYVVVAEGVIDFVPPAAAMG
jgi:hypothetical protein